jgi:regulator of sigma D
VVLLVPPDRELSEDLIYPISHERNHVLEMYAELRAIKPLRDRKAPLSMPDISIQHQPEGWRFGPL